MNSQPWIVKKRNGETWGRIRRVLIDPATRQIISVDVALDDTGKLVRVPWLSLEIENNDIVLLSSDMKYPKTTRSTEGGLPDTVTIEVSHPHHFPHEHAL